MATSFYLQALLEFIAIAADAFNIRHVTKDSVVHIDKSKASGVILMIIFSPMYLR